MSRLSALSHKFMSPEYSSLSGVAATCGKALPDSGPHPRCGCSRRRPGNASLCLQNLQSLKFLLRDDAVLPASLGVVLLQHKIQFTDLSLRSTAGRRIGHEALRERI